MRTWLAVVLALAAAAPIALFSSNGAAQERRIALVVGNARYPEVPLRNPVNDARAMAAALRDRGFEVLLRENATKQQMESAVADFGEKLNEGSTGLFFYAGHGMQVNGRNYLVPVDARITSEPRVRLEALDVDAVLDQMQAAKSKVNVVILDACRNNPFERRFRSAGGGLAQINAPEGTLIAYATAPGKVAADGDGSNGLYTQELLRALRTPGLKVEDVFKQVRINVSRASQGGQTPWEASSLVGDFYFVAPEPPKPAPPPPSPQELVEQQLWEAAKSSADTAELQVYLRQFPNGLYATEARQRVAALKQKTETAGSRPDDFLERTLWDMVRSSNDPAEVQFFLRQFPNSALATQARQRLAALPPVPATTSVPPAPPPAAPDPRVAVAIVPPKTNEAGASFNGRYRASITGATLLAQQIPAEIEINGTRVTGTAMREGQPRPCPISGSINEDGTVRSSLRIECEPTAHTGGQASLYGHLVISLDGRFTRSEQAGNVIVETPFRTNQGRTGTITWQRVASLPSAAVAVSSLDGRYTAKVRNFYALNNVEIDSSFELVGGQIKGTGYLQPGWLSCPLNGVVTIDGALRMTLSCDGSGWASSSIKNSVTLVVTGHFLQSDGNAVAETTFRSNEGRTGTVTWRRQN